MSALIQKDILTVRTNGVSYFLGAMRSAHGPFFKTMQITGKITKVYYTKEGWSSFSLKDSKDNSLHKCAGNTFGELKEGMTVEVTGSESMTNYGIQLQISSFKVPMPVGTEGIRSYLSSGLIKGIGPSLADRIVSTFGDDTLKIIRETPEKLLTVNGISEKKISSITSAVSEFSGYEEIFELTGGSITKLQAGKIIKEFGKNAPKILKGNPYILYEKIDGFGFLLTDKIAKSCGISELSQSRLKAAINYVLIQIGELSGHCYVPISQMQNEALDILHPMPKDLSDIKGFRKNTVELLDSWPESKPAIIEKYHLDAAKEKILSEWAQVRLSYIDGLAQALMTCSDEGSVVIKEENVASERLHRAENYAAEAIKERLSRQAIEIDPADIYKCISEYESSVGFTLSQAQKDAVANSITNHIALITGGPGTGKTSTIESIIYTYKKLTGGNVILMAPTGRAAARIKEKLIDKSVVAATIHKMTGAGKMLPLLQPSKKTLIIVDESSMINIELACIVLRYATEAAGIIFVGDKDQLPSIGAGNFFRDMLMSGVVPKTTLHLGFRNAGLIAQNAAAVNSGNTHLESGSDFHINLMEREDIAKKIVSDYIAALNSGSEPKDMCLLCLQRSRGAVCVDILNRKIQDAINPRSDENTLLEGTCFRVSDRVMQIHNNYQQEYVLADGTKGKGIFNGDTGTIISMHPELDTLTVAYDDGRISEYERISFQDLVLSYAVTVHKSQGSEYYRIFMAVTLDAFTLLSRSICYTGLTRASKEVNLYAEKKALSIAIRQETNSKRNTRLIKLLSTQDENE